ncbi:MAG: type II secretion system F family protein [Candidatus Nanopelagicales bacterium]|nr:type II secretion system F family protein [Candidatus Nanopelagicales bacterium]
MSLATFDYQVRDRTGKLVRGRIDAESASVVATKLKGMGYAPISIAEANAGLNRELHLPGMGAKVKLKDLAISARQFATMINSGLSLLRALSILAEQTENKKLAEVYASVRIAVEQGSSLSQALGQHPDVFPPIMVNMTRAGETGGFLDTVLLQLAENFEAEVKLRAKIKSAMTYPAVVFGFAIISMTAMLLFIVPVFAGLFDSLGGVLPLPTRILVAISSILKMAMPVLIVLLIVGLTLWRKFKNDPRVRNVVDPMKLKAPVFGSLFQKVALSRFSRNLGTMIHAGVPILQSLDIVADTTGNVVIARAVRDVEKSVRQGESLADAAQDLRLLRRRSRGHHGSFDLDHRADHDRGRRRHDRSHDRGPVHADLQDLRVDQVGQLWLITPHTQVHLVAASGRCAPRGWSTPARCHPNG